MALNKQELDIIGKFIGKANKFIKENGENTTLTTLISNLETITTAQAPPTTPAPTSAPTTDTKFTWWTNEPIRVNYNDRTVKVYVNIGRHGMTSETTSSVSITGSFQGSGSVTVQSSDTESPDSNYWRTYAVTLNVPQDFVGGTLTLAITGTLNGSAITFVPSKNISLTTNIEGITEAGQEVIDYFNSFNIDGVLHHTKEFLLKEDLNPAPPLTLTQLLALKEKLETVRDNITNNVLNPGNSLSSDAQVLLNTILEKQPSDETVKAHYKLTYNGLWADNMIAYKNAISLHVYLDKTGLSGLNSIFLTPINEMITGMDKINSKIAAIRTEISKQETAFDAYIKTLDSKGGSGILLVKNIAQAIKAIHKELTTKFSDFKVSENYSFVTESDGTDPFKLVVKDTQLIRTGQQQLNAIKSTIDTQIDLIIAAHGELYNSRGVIVREHSTLRREARGKDDKLTLDFGKISTKSFSIHAHLFNKVKLFIDSVKALCNEFYPIWLDFSHINSTNDEMSISAYNPLLGDKIEENLKKQQKEWQTLNPNHEIKITAKHEDGTSIRVQDEHGINPEDVQQGAVGDCYFLSSLDALARTAPNNIYGNDNSIIISDGRGNFTVRLFIPDSSAENRKRRVSIAVNPSFVKKRKQVKNPDGTTNSEHSDSEFLFSKAGGQSEMWVQLIEKALAQLEGSYAEISGGKTELNLSGWEILTGDDNIQRNTLPDPLPLNPTEEQQQAYDNTINGIIRQIVSHYVNNRNQVPAAQFGTKSIFATGSTSDDESESGEPSTLYRPNTKIYANHAYTLANISGYDEVDPENPSAVLNHSGISFTLQNPHNHDLKDNVLGGREIEINRTELITYFSSIKIF